jgi:hypothetical protein
MQQIGGYLELVVFLLQLSAELFQFLSESSVLGELIPGVVLLFLELVRPLLVLDTLPLMTLHLGQ